MGVPFEPPLALRTFAQGETPEEGEGSWGEAGWFLEQEALGGILIVEFKRVGNKVSRSVCARIQPTVQRIPVRLICQPLDAPLIDDCSRAWFYIPEETVMAIVNGERRRIDSRRSQADCRAGHDNWHTLLPLRPSASSEWQFQKLPSKSVTLRNGWNRSRGCGT